MRIRMAHDQDYSEIYRLVKTAFETAKVSDGTEQDFVLKLRKDKNYIPELELVAEENGKLMGHIMFTKQEIITKDEPFIGLLVAPLCVAIECRSKGVGKQLMNNGIEKAKELGYTASFLIGDFEYYKRLGYKKITDFAIKNETKIPEEHVLAYEIQEGALDGIEGRFFLEEDQC